MNANEKLGLPRDKMKTIKIAFDIDGTLRCNCTEVCRDINKSILNLAIILDNFKNVELWAWSGGGGDYVKSFVHSNSVLSSIFKDNRCISKIGAPQMDIAIDDIQDTALGTFNLIVKEK